MNGELHPETLAIRGAKEQTNYNEHNQALFITSSFMFDSAADGAALFKGEKAGFTYSRTANPTTAAFAKRIAILEGGEAAVATSTGMAAINAALLTFLSAGDHLICSRSLFGTTMGLLNNHIARFGIEISFVSQTDLDEWRAPCARTPKCCSSKPRPTRSTKWPIWNSWPTSPIRRARCWWWTTAS